MLYTRIETGDNMNKSAYREGYSSIMRKEAQMLAGGIYGAGKGLLSAGKRMSAPGKLQSLPKINGGVTNIRKGGISLAKPTDFAPKLRSKFNKLQKPSIMQNAGKKLNSLGNKSVNYSSQNYNKLNKLEGMGSNIGNFGDNAGLL